MSRLVHLVLDWDLGDPAAEELVDWIAAALHGAVVQVQHVEPGDSEGAGRHVARFAARPAPAAGRRIVAHEVSAGPGEPAAWPVSGDACFCAARSRTGVLVVGGNVAAAWAQAAPQLGNLCRVDVPSAGPAPHPPTRLAAAIAHVCAGHPHAVTGVMVERPAAASRG